MENERKKKTVRLVPPTRKEPLSQRTVSELFSGSASTQLVKASTPAEVEVETSAKKLPSAWTSLLLKDKSLTNQEATVSAALSIEKSNIAQISGSLTQNPSMSPDVGSTSEWRGGKNYERNQKRKQRKRLLKGLEGLNLINPGNNNQTASNSASTKRSMESSSTQSRTSELLRKEPRALRTLYRVRRQPVPTKADRQLIPYSKIVVFSKFIPCISNRSTTNASINQKQIPARKTKSNGSECWQINPRRCKTASYNLCEVTKNIRSGIVLIQEPWTYGGAIRSKLRGWKLFQGNKKDKRPRACIYVTSDMPFFLIPQFSSDDVVAVRVRNRRREGDSFVFVSVYMALEEPATPVILKELLSFNDRDKIPTVIGTDANAHHTIWGSSNNNTRGMDLLMYCASANLHFCYVNINPLAERENEKC